MFKYEDMDFQSLTTSLDIENPDGPEELYAMAQFCRMGKGTQASEENYRFYLQRAADAGSEQAKQELDALDNADAASAAAGRYIPLDLEVFHNAALRNIAE